MGPTRLVLVRHGENPANVTKEFSCRKVDYSLTDKGRLQALQTAEHLAGFPVAEIWTSPLRRARETAAEVARFHPCPVQVLEDLREMDVGDLEGMEPQAAAWDHYRTAMVQWFGGNSDHRFPGGESRRELCLRFGRALEILARDKAGKTLVVVGHGGIFTHGVAELCGIADQRTFFGLENHNCSLSTVEVTWEGSRPGFRLVNWASVDHLSGEAAQVVESVPEAFRVKNLADR